MRGEGKASGVPARGGPRQYPVDTWRDKVSEKVDTFPAGFSRSGHFRGAIGSARARIQTARDRNFPAAIESAGHDPEPGRPTPEIDPSAIELAAPATALDQPAIEPAQPMTESPRPRRDSARPERDQTRPQSNQLRPRL